MPVYEPVLEQPASTRLEVWAQREQPGVIAWGFWGGVVSVVVAAYIVWEASTALLSLGDVLVISAVLLTGLVVFRLGRRSNLEKERLFEVDGRYQTLSWPSEGGAAPKALAFDDVEAVVFSIVDVPVPGSRAGTKLSAAQVSVRTTSGEAHPVVAASPSKGEAHRVARGLGRVLSVEVDYEGAGVGEWA